MMWKLRYGARGVHVDLVEARNLAEAEAVGRAFCAAAPADGDSRRRFIRIDGAAVVADPSILVVPPAGGSMDAAAPEKPSRAARGAVKGEAATSDENAESA